MEVTEEESTNKRDQIHRSMLGRLRCCRVRVFEGMLRLEVD